jgi:hypothetical protein
MNWLVILLIVVSAGFVLFSLIRGLVYFARSSDAVREGGNGGSGQEGDGPSEMHLMQNRMMFARVKWQAITILLLIVLGFVASAR